MRRARTLPLAALVAASAISCSSGGGGVTPPPPPTYSLTADPIASVKKGQPFTSCVTASPSLDQIVGTYESTSQGSSGTRACLTTNADVSTSVSWSGTVGGVTKASTSASFTILPPAVAAQNGNAAFDQGDSTTVDLAALTSGDAARTYGFVPASGLTVRQSGSKLVIKSDTPGAVALAYFTAAQGDTARAAVNTTVNPLANVNYLIKDAWGNTMTSETFTAALSNGKTLTSVNGVLTGKVPTTATFTLTSPNTFPAKVIYTPSTALAALTDTLNGVYAGKDSATIHFTAAGMATQGTIIAHQYNTTRSPNKMTYDQYRFIFGGAGYTGRPNPNYNGMTDTVSIFFDTVTPAQGEIFNLNKSVNVYVVDQPSAGWLSPIYQAPTAVQLQGMNDAVTAWNAILSPLGMNINLLHGTPPSVSVLNNSTILAVAPGNASLGIANNNIGSINGTNTSSTIKQGGSGYLIVSNNASVSRGIGDNRLANQITAMSELGDGLVGTRGQGEDPFNRDVFHIDNPNVVPNQIDLDFYQVRFKITGPLILKNELEFEKTGTAPWPRNILLGPATSPWTTFQTYTASDGKPALQPVYIGGPLSQSTSLAAPLVTFQATAAGTHVTPTTVQRKLRRSP